MAWTRFIDTKTFNKRKTEFDVIYIEADNASDAVDIFLDIFDIDPLNSVGNCSVADFGLDYDESLSNLRILLGSDIKECIFTENDIAKLKENRNPSSSQTFVVSVEMDVVLAVTDLWPNGGAPDNPTAEDVERFLYSLDLKDVIALLGDITALSVYGPYDS